MDSLSLAIRRCNLGLRLDDPTEGFGNCFPNAIIQQSRRPEIETWLQKNRPLALFNDQQSLRSKVTNFAIRSHEQAISNLRTKYEKEIGPAENKSWGDYWSLMAQDGTWVDHIFIQMTAWYMKLDILILTSSSQPEHPFIFISGNATDAQGTSSNPPLLIGNYTNIHYQSLLQDQRLTSVTKVHESENEKKLRANRSDQIKSLGIKSDKFIFKQGKLEITFKSLDIQKWECPFCRLVFARIGQHIKAKNCPISHIKIDKVEFKTQFDLFNEGYRLEMNRKRKEKSRAKLHIERDPEIIKAQSNRYKQKLRDKIGPEVFKAHINKYKQKSRIKLKKEKGPEIIKAQLNEYKQKLREKKGPGVFKALINKYKQKSRDKKRVELGPKKIKQQQNDWHMQFRKRQLQISPETVRNNETKRKKLSRNKQRKGNEEKLKEDQRKWKHKSRVINSQKERLKKFRKRTMFNAIFTCSSCHRNLFDCNVCKMDHKLITEIEIKKTGLYERAIEIPIEVEINGVISSYICFACKKHLKSGKLPPMAATNGLKVYHHDPELELTELEGNLIAKRIVFMKIFQLPKTRWTALKDKVINVPVHEDDIVNTITSLPRTPNEAGLIEVDLKRKVEFKNSHIKQLIDPSKCYKMLALLKQKKNPHYKFYDDFNTYSERCKKSDFKGYTFIFDEQTEMIENISDKNMTIPRKLDESDIAELLEDEYHKKDPVKKYQFNDYNKSLCMSSNYPEMGPGNSVIIAPGEGKRPQNILFDHDWDILAFPHLNSPDGKYGLHHPRVTKLQDQYFFVQRICNKNMKFARSPAYVYAAVAHTELKQIQRNINISYSRGRETNSHNGVKTLKLEDPFAVLDDIKQTPRYWRKAKYEIFAKLDNFGPFQFFFTLSCADLRWDENFAAILRQKGLTLKYTLEDDLDGYPKTTIHVEENKDGHIQTIPLKDYLAKQEDKSLHELIRGNVLLATRYFNHRVKAFISTIILGGGNFMMVDYYSYKTEFQDRGAGHIHGVLWI